MQCFQHHPAGCPSDPAVRHHCLLPTDQQTETETGRGTEGQNETGTEKETGRGIGTGTENETGRGTGIETGTELSPVRQLQTRLLHHRRRHTNLTTSLALDLHVLNPLPAHIVRVRIYICLYQAHKLCLRRVGLLMTLRAAGFTCHMELGLERYQKRHPISNSQQY